MKIKPTVTFIALALLTLSTLNSQFATCFAQGTAFTYQGRLNGTNGPVNGSYDLTFTLFNTNTTGVAVAGPVTNSATSVSSGLFLVTLDFGGVFTGSNYWLEIGVRTNGNGAFTTLTPRQAVTPTPYAIFAEGASNVVGVVPSGGLSGSYASAVTLNNAANSFNGSYTGNGGGLTNVNAAALNGLTAGRFWQLGGNNVTPGKFLGSTNNQPVDIWVNNQRVVQLAYASNAASGYSPNVVLGHSGNYVSNGVVGATIVGGGSTNGLFFPSTNRVLADFGTVVGGYGNTASGMNSIAMGVGSVASGSQSTAMGNASATGDYSTAMGNSSASGNYSTAMGASGAGAVNATAMGASAASGLQSTAMGYSIASGYASTAAGLSTASGLYSTAMGRSTATNLNSTATGTSVALGQNSTAMGQSMATNLDDTAMGQSAASGYYSTAMGQCVASGEYSTAMGASTASGRYSTAMGQSAASGYWSTAMGNNSSASGDDATAMGEYSTASGEGATAMGASTASGQFSTAMGIATASGQTSFAAGYDANATLAGSFVWNSFPATANSNDDHRFHVFGANGFDVEYFSQRLDGGGTHWAGIGIISGQTIGTWTGAYLSDSGVWQNASDRNRKTGFAPVNPQEVLAKVAALPVQSWRYTNETDVVRHLGPVAQDFKAAFGLGTDDKSIGTVDEEGVALAAIQGLNQKLETESKVKDAEIQTLKQQNDSLAERLNKLEAAVEQLATQK
jgi:hypothetical protein